MTTQELFEQMLAVAYWIGPGPVLSSMLHEFNENRCPWTRDLGPLGIQTIRSAYVEGDGILLDSVLAPRQPAQFIQIEFTL